MDDLQYTTQMSTADFLLITLIALVAICFLAWILLCRCSPADICDLLEDEREEPVIYWGRGSGKVKAMEEARAKLEKGSSHV